MIGIYCRARHRTRKDLCEDCRALLDYAKARLLRCPFRDDKPACFECTVHCYRPDMRKRMVEVMRYAEPRMPVRHPLLALKHLLRKRKNHALSKV